MTASSLDTCPNDIWRADDRLPGLLRELTLRNLRSVQSLSDGDTFGSWGSGMPIVQHVFLWAFCVRDAEVDDDYAKDPRLLYLRLYLRLYPVPLTQETASS
eukprot:1553148-Pyramimonas_sp.AAC.2